MLSTVASQKQWADLVAANADVWAKGLSGEQLSDAEEVGFDALASAWHFDHFGAWPVSRRSALEVDREVAPERTQSLIREAALDIHANPGLHVWVAELREMLRQVGRFSLYNEMLEEETGRVEKERASVDSE